MELFIQGFTALDCKKVCVLKGPTSIVVCISADAENFLTFDKKELRKPVLKSHANRYYKGLPRSLSRVCQNVFRHAYRDLEEFTKLTQSAISIVSFIIMCFVQNIQMTRFIPLYGGIVYFILIKNQLIVKNNHQSKSINIKKNPNLTRLESTDWSVFTY